ncbi:nucleoside 5-triphosphatase RdgB [Bacillus sp. JCM 19046]|nr:nucleoside 5-triphosphatase RdgB [Bacillus sp. JCM 19046]
MYKVYIASWNEAKRKEIRDALSQIQGRLQLVDYNDVYDVEETGTTFEENALLKARHLSKHTQGIIVAEDSGLVVEALNGEPGVKTARFFSGTDHDRAHKLQRRMAAVSIEKRQAYFQSVVAVLFPDGTIKTTSGVLSGWISTAPIPAKAGYDGLFLLSNGKRLAQADDVYAFTHRQIALEQAKREIKIWLVERQHHE